MNDPGERRRLQQCIAMLEHEASEARADLARKKELLGAFLGDVRLPPTRRRWWYGGACVGLAAIAMLLLRAPPSAATTAACSAAWPPEVRVRIHFDAVAPGARPCAIDFVGRPTPWSSLDDVEVVVVCGDRTLWRDPTPTTSFARLSPAKRHGEWDVDYHAAPSSLFEVAHGALTVRTADQDIHVDIETPTGVESFHLNVIGPGVLTRATADE